MEHQRSYGNAGFSIKIFVSYAGFLYRKHQIEPIFDTVYQMLVPWERVSNVLELLHDSPSAGHFGIEKRYQRACEYFLAVNEKGLKEIDRTLLRVPIKERR